MQKKLIYILIALLGIGAAVFMYFHSSAKALTLVSNDDLKAQFPMVYVEGSPDAPLVMIEFSSLTCTHCKHFDEAIYPEIVKDFVDTNKMRIAFVDFPIDGVALKASTLTHCVDPSQYVNMVDTLFQNQEKWAHVPNSEDVLRNYAKLSGMSDDEVTACLANQDLVNKIVESRMKVFKDMNINVTPTFVFNLDLDEKIEGALPYSVFKNKINDLLGRKFDAKKT